MWPNIYIYKEREREMLTKNNPRIYVKNIDKLESLMSVFTPHQHTKKL